MPRGNLGEGHGSRSKRGERARSVVQVYGMRGHGAQTDKQRGWRWGAHRKGRSQGGLTGAEEIALETHFVISVPPKPSVCMQILLTAGLMLRKGLQNIQIPGLAVFSPLT